IYLDSTGLFHLNYQVIDNGSFDSCGYDTIYTYPNLLNCNNLGTDTVLLIIRDNALNADTCFALVTLLDTISPIISCRADTVYLDSLGSITVFENQFIDSIFDNCAIDSIWLNKNQFTCADTGLFPIKIYAVDFSGNIDSCQTTLLIIDSILPTLTCPQN